MTDITFDTVHMQDGLVNVLYEVAVAYHGNATPLSGSSISSGSLPPGLALDTSLPFTRITGTPTADGFYTFRVTLTDAAGSVQSPDLTIRINTIYIDVGMNQTAVANVKQEWPQS